MLFKQTIIIVHRAELVRNKERVHFNFINLSTNVLRNYSVRLVLGNLGIVAPPLFSLNNIFCVRLIIEARDLQWHHCRMNFQNSGLEQWFFLPPVHDFNILNS